jgi:hypothetical protein
MSRVHEEKVDLLLLSLLNQWLKGLCFEGFLSFNINFSRDLLDFAANNLVLFKKLAHLRERSFQTRHILDDGLSFFQGSWRIRFKSSDDLVFFSRSKLALPW